MMPLVKGQRTEAEIAAGHDPDCRPVAIGEVDLCAIGRALTLQVQQPAEAYLAPQQLGVAVKGGISILVHGIRLLLTTDNLNHHGHCWPCTWAHRCVRGVAIANVRTLWCSTREQPHLCG